MSENADEKEDKTSPTEMFPLNIKIKQEKTTSYGDSSKSETVDKLSIDVNLSNIFSQTTSSNAAGATAAEASAKEVKSVEPLKSSNEILTELFKVFNAAPPEIIDDDSNGAADKKKKKHKHKKKSKKKKRTESGAESLTESESGEDEKIRNKVKKIKKEKKEKHNKHKEKNKDVIEKQKQKKKDKHAAKPEMLSAVVKKEPKEHWHADHSSKDYHFSSSRDLSYRAIKQEKDNRYGEHEKPGLKERDPAKEDSRNKSKIQIKSLKDSIVFKEVASKEREKERERERSRFGTGEMRKRRSESDFSLSDEESYNQGRYYDFYEKKYNSFYASYKDEDHHRHRKRKRSEERERYRKSRTKSRSRSPQFDKQKLLEIARKNAISMLKKGTLPGAQGLDKESKDKIIMKMKNSGKSISELTEYCKKISDKDNLNELSSVSSDDSDHDADGGSKAFHHPFQIKDPGPIVMNIKNSVPLQPKSAEQTKALLMQFPVSSGAQHRKMENEWVPVEPKPPQPVLPVAIIRPEKPAPKILPTSATFVPQAEQQPAYTPVNPPAPPAVTAPPPISAVPVPHPVLPQPNPSSSTVPIMSIPPPVLTTPTPSVAALPTPIETPQVEVFPNMAEAEKLDVSTIISQRLNAMRKLQDNPGDAEAIKMFYNTQKDMSAWASSKFTPGQFLGTTGVQCLSQRELAEGYQPWAKRDSLKQTAPVTGGMGMHLLQKMGWVPGEGLGKEKNGSLEPLLLDVKLDKRGLVASAEDQQRQMQYQMQQQQQQQHGGRGRARFANVKIVTDGKHPVSILGEYSSKRKWIPPRYELVHESGPGHAKNFVFKVIVNGLEYQPAIANNTKKDAKATAAKFCLQQLGILQS